MKVLKKFDWDPRPRNRGSKYDKYLDGKVYMLTSKDCNGADFESVRRYLYALGMRSGRSVRTSIRPDTRTGEECIVVQAIGGDDD